jgi:hypothetical protein
MTSTMDKDELLVPKTQLPDEIEQANQMLLTAVKSIRTLETSMPSAFQSLYDATEKYASQGVNVVVQMFPEVQHAYDAWLRDREKEVT